MSSIAPENNTRRKGRVSDSWITPEWLIKRLGEFDLDPCACDPQPWRTAAEMTYEAGNGLGFTWEGFVYCNPPCGKQLGTWLERMAEHDNGIALVFARTDTKAFHDHVWPNASAMLFLRGRLTFARPDGTYAEYNCGGPSVLIGYGHKAFLRLLELIDIGRLIQL